MKTDEQFHEEVDFLLESLRLMHQDFSSSYHELIQAAGAVLAEAQGDANPRRLIALRRTFEKANLRFKAYYQTMKKNLDALRDTLKEWRSPGRDYARFADEARRIRTSYIDAGNEMIVVINTLVLAVEDLQAAGQ